MKITGGDAILRSLEAEGVEVMFGIPGGAIMPTYDAIARGTTVRHVLARHEQGAGHMAEGYARASGRVGVAIDTIDDMRDLLADLPLDRVSTSMTINATASILLALYVAVARSRGVPLDRLSGTVQNDVLKEYIARGTYIYPPEGSLRLATDIFALFHGQLIIIIRASLTWPSRGVPSTWRMHDIAPPQVGKRTSFTFRPISVSRLYRTASWQSRGSG